MKQTKSLERAHKESPQRAPAKPAVSSPKAKKQSPKVVGKKAPRRSMSPPRSPPSPHEGSYTETFESSTSKTDDNVSELRDNCKQAEPIRGRVDVFHHIVLYSHKVPTPVLLPLGHGYRLLLFVPLKNNYY